jgi:hypothetical protein
MKQEYLMLAKDFDPKKQSPAGMFASEKLDGFRCFSDGGISRGMYCTDVPYAYTDKHHRYQFAQKATGLWTRYGQPIQAPDWFLDQLPRILLDGELTCGRGAFQKTLSLKTLIPDDALWKQTIYKVFDSPPVDVMFADRYVNNSNCKLRISGMKSWLEKHSKLSHTFNYPFRDTYVGLKKFVPRSSNVELLDQFELPWRDADARDVLMMKCEQIIRDGGEGMMLRNGISIWAPERMAGLLKVKPYKDMEVTVIGYRWGKPTDVARSISGEATDRLVGLMGSVFVRMDSGLEFEVGSGFTLEERKLINSNDSAERGFKSAFFIGSKNPGELATDAINSLIFKRGSKITIKYRELTDRGIPKEARYFRKSN